MAVISQKHGVAKLFKDMREVESMFNLGHIKHGDIVIRLTPETCYVAEKHDYIKVR